MNTLEPKIFCTATFFVSPRTEFTTLSPHLLVRLLWISYQILLTSALTVFWTPDLYRIIKRLCHAEERKSGGGPRSRTANVYHEGPDLQSGDAHALASRPPNFGTGGEFRNLDSLVKSQILCL
jgi:hypothetical protein